ncbi:Class I SAM-dependent methyltransferase [Frankia sp. AiPs1]|uniref:class I SAM-dependent methyltransferase n=1 Tax=Frankia sp. AiPa1 TaxID=573492 RepID=UPI00202B1779|nr:class I SAM-dependent methyltransferase [Frankia sp. AiPa1]MCL9760360.1 class I SAM-dependent methyltransferase [Frankia sp. AiPa1]
MNKRHLETLSSPGWATMLRQNLLPWVESIADLGDDVLEIGPGPGLTTDILRTRTARLTAVEIDPGLAAALAARLAGTNVTVITRSAEQLDLAESRFTGAACFGVIHHVPSPAQQDRIFSEILRVLRPGAALVGSDGYDNELTRQAHIDDVFVPLDAEALPSRLAQLGFTDIRVEHGEYDFRYAARKPPRRIPPGR